MCQSCLPKTEQGFNLHGNLVPRSLVDEAEGEILPICITRSPVRNVTGKVTGLRHDLGIFARISKFRCFHQNKQTQNEV